MQNSTFRRVKADVKFYHAKRRQFPATGSDLRVTQEKNILCFIFISRIVCLPGSAATRRLFFQHDADFRNTNLVFFILQLQFFVFIDWL